MNLKCGTLSAVDAILSKVVTVAHFSTIAMFCCPIHTSRRVSICGAHYRNITTLISWLSASYGIRSTNTLQCYKRALNLRQSTATLSHYQAGRNHVAVPLLCCCTSSACHGPSASAFQPPTPHRSRVVTDYIFDLVKLSEYCINKLSVKTAVRKNLVYSVAQRCG